LLQSFSLLAHRAGPPPRVTACIYDARSKGEKGGKEPITLEIIDRLRFRQTEVEVPGASLAARKVALDAASEMHERVASAVGGIDWLEVTQARDKANAEERAAAKASASKRPWWRLGR